MSGIPDSTSKPIFNKIMEVLVETLEISDEDKINLEQCYYADPIIDKVEQIKYLKKGNIGVQLPPHIMEQKVMKYISLHSFWNAIFKALITSDSEQLLLFGNSSFKTFLASLIKPDANIADLYQGLNVDRLFGSIDLIFQEETKEYYLEQFCSILGIIQVG